MRRIKTFLILSKNRPFAYQNILLRIILIGSVAKGWVEEHLLLIRLPQDLCARVSGRPDTLTYARELEKVTDCVLRTGLIATNLIAQVQD